MKRLAWVFLMAAICTFSFGQNVKKIGNSINSRDRGRINDVITQSNSYYTLKANVASPTFTGTVTIPTLSVSTAASLPATSVSGVVSLDSTLTLGTFGDATQTKLSEASSNTNALLGVYPMINTAASAGKVFAGTYNRLLLITTAQTHDASMFGAEDQLRVKGVNLGTGVHAGLWAYAEQSGTTVLSGAGTFSAINAAIESGSAFSCGATEYVTGITVDCSLNGSAAINADATFAGLYIKSNGLDWKTGIKITGVDSIDIEFQNGATIDNENSDTLRFTETNFSFQGAIYLNGASVSDFAITDYQVPLLDYWAKTQELNHLPAFESKDRRNINTYISGVEEATERNLRYIVELEARIRELEGKLK
jgi:hypothetical protein